MKEELDSIEKNQTWEMVTPPPGCKPIGLKWVYKIKRNSHGDIVRYKARLVAKGYVQNFGIDYEEVFAPVARIETIRVLLALAAQEGWQVHHMDVKSAFLNGELKEEVYVKQERGKILLSQKSYALRILEQSGMSECNPAHTRLESRCKFGKETHPRVNPTTYRSLMGSLKYLTHTRPDLMFSVGYLSRYMENPTTEHMSAVKRILRYVKGTLDLGLVYEKNEAGIKLVGYSDSDYAGDPDDRKSTTGMAFFLGNNLICWASQKQKIVALSSCEAEYVAATTAACQGIWLARLIGELMNKEMISMTLMVNNKSAIALSKNPVFHNRSKHIETKFHYIRTCLEEKKMELDFISSENQLADLFTKSLGRLKFEQLRQRLGIRTV